MTEAEQPTLDALIEFVRSLTEDDAFRDDFKNDPAGAIGRKGLDLVVPEGLEPPGDDLPARERYRDVLDVLEILENLNRLGPGGMVEPLVCKFFGPPPPPPPRTSK